MIGIFYLVQIRFNLNNIIMEFFFLFNFLDPAWDLVLLVTGTESRISLGFLDMYSCKELAWLAIIWHRTRVAVAGTGRPRVSRWSSIILV